MAWREGIIRAKMLPWSMEDTTRIHQEAVLSALKAAATRVENQYDPTYPALPPFARRKQSYDDRLAVGFAMMGGKS